MIIGAHTIITSTNPKADAAFFREVLKLPFVELDGPVIFGLPPAEVAIHESRGGGTGHEFWFMCGDIAVFTAEMTKRGIAFSTPMKRGWGTMTEITLPGGGKLGVYQPHHTRPKAVTLKTKKPAVKKKVAKKKPAKRAAKKKAAKRGKRR